MFNNDIVQTPIKTVIKQKISTANKGRHRDKSVVEKWINDVAKKSKSPEHRKKIARYGFVMLKNVKTGDTACPL